jgi:hypothetical protein
VRAVDEGTFQREFAVEDFGLEVFLDAFLVEQMSSLLQWVYLRYFDYIVAYFACWVFILFVLLHLGYV